MKNLDLSFFSRNVKNGDPFVFENEEYRPLFLPILVVLKNLDRNVWTETI